MGEIIFSIFVGGWMCLTGILLIWWISREEKNNAGNASYAQKDGEKA